MPASKADRFLDLTGVPRQGQKPMCDKPMPILSRGVFTSDL